MSYLSFISDENLELEVGKVLLTATDALKAGKAKLNKNVIDPFSVAFEMAGFGIKDVSAWETTELTRQSQKTLSNAFGMFHQNILGHINGWENLASGRSVDLRCKEKKIIAEVKNKHNTISGGKLGNVYDHLDQLVMPIEGNYKGYTAYYVEIIPKPKSSKPQKYDIPFTPSDPKTKTKKTKNELIRKIDGQSFYNLATGIPDALKQLYAVLPKVISNVSPYEFSPTQIKDINAYFDKAFV